MQTADGAHDFDFLFGDWHIINERLTSRITGSHPRYQFEARGHCRPILGGIGNVDEFQPSWPGHEGYWAMALRLFNLSSGLWTIYWIDNVVHGVQPPVEGRFDGGVGHFYGDDEHNGTLVRVWFQWSQITPVSARWEQSFSVDGGATWEPNWIMTFTRIPDGEKASAR